jgi:hypothetical protein
MAEDKLQNSDSGEDQNAAGEQTGKISIDGKDYTESDVKNLLAQSGKATQALQRDAELNKLAAQIGTDVETLTEHLPHMVGAVAKGIESGVMTTDYQFVEPSSTTDEGSDDDGETGVDNEAVKTLSGKLDQLMSENKKLRERIDVIDSHQLSEINKRMEKEIIATNPILEKDDVPKVLARAKGDKSKHYLDHAKDIAAEKEAKMEGVIKERYKKDGLDYDKIQDRNKLRQASSEGGAAAMVEGKTISWRKNAGENAITPGQAYAAAMEAEQE